MHGMVSVGLPATTVAALGLPLVRRVRERYPSILLNVVEGMSGHLGQMMRMGQLDLAVLFSGDVAPDVSVEPPARGGAVRACCPSTARSSPRGARASPSPRPRRCRSSCPPATHGLRRRIAAEFEQRSLSAHIVAEIDSLSLLMNCVYDGHGRHHQADGRRVPRRRDAAGSGARCSISDARHDAGATTSIRSRPSGCRRPRRWSPPSCRRRRSELVESGAWSGVETIGSARRSPQAASAARRTGSR